MAEEQEGSLDGKLPDKFGILSQDVRLESAMMAFPIPPRTSYKPKWNWVFLQTCPIVQRFSSDFEKISIQLFL